MAELSLKKNGGDTFTSQEPLLMTKLLIPPARTDLVRRTRLFERLNDGIKRKLTIVSAPAGFGKTTLLSAWTDTRPNGKSHTAWLSLDEEDNDPVRFWVYFIKALGTLQTQVKIGENALPLLTSPAPPQTESVLTSLINELAAIPEDFIVILDDYHIIRALPIHQSLSFMLDYLPPNMHLILSGRGEPPLPLARLRAADQLIELGSADLRFTLTESETFLNQIMGFSIPSEDVAVLEARTDGWIAGLQMAAFSMQTQENVSSFIDSFAGDDRNIQDYLTEEVLARQPRNIQTFLMKTSILDRVTGPLCDAVIGDENRPAGHTGREARGQETLEALERSKLFLISLDNKRQWYRYHPLFRDVLRRLLDQEDPSHIQELHRRASRWYEVNGLPDEALGHALAAQDFNSLLRLLERTGWPMLLHGEVNLLLQCMEALPAEMIRARPRLSLFHAFALLRSEQFEGVEPLLRDAEQGFGLMNGERKDKAVASEVEERELRGAMAAIRAKLSLDLGDVPRTIELSRQALEYLSERNLFLRGIVAMNLGDAYTGRDDLEAAIKAHSEASAISRAAGDTFETVLAVSKLGRLYATQGHLNLAVNSYREALEIAQPDKGPPTPAAALANMGLGEVLLEWNELDTAAGHLSKAIDLFETWGHNKLLVDSYIILSRIQYAQKKAGESLRTIKAAERLARRHNYTLASLSIAGIQARNWAITGNIQAAMAWIQSSNLKPDDDFSSHYSRLVRSQYATLARVLIAQGEIGQAMELLERLEKIAQQTGRMGNLIEVLVYTALAFKAQGDINEAVLALIEGLKLGESEGFIRTFLAEGPLVAELLNTVIQRRQKKSPDPSQDLSKDYLNKLASAFELETTPTTSQRKLKQPLAEPLSEREIEVLQLLIAGRSNKDIGEELFVAVNTVKTHIRNIYAKLGVQSRTQAVAKVKELNLFT